MTGVSSFDRRGDGGVPVPRSGSSGSMDAAVNCEPLAELGRDACGARVWLGRSIRDGNVLAFTGDGRGSALLPAVDIHANAAAAGCNFCGEPHVHMRRRCARCGSDLSGVAVESGPGTTRSELQARAMEAAQGRFHLLGDIARAEGGGLLFVARETATSRLIALRLERRMDAASGRECHELAPVQQLVPATEDAIGWAHGDHATPTATGGLALGDFPRPAASAASSSHPLTVLMPVADAAERGFTAHGAGAERVRRERLPMVAYVGVGGLLALGMMAFAADPVRSAAQNTLATGDGARPATMVQSRGAIAPRSAGQATTSAVEPAGSAGLEGATLNGTARGAAQRPLTSTEPDVVAGVAPAAGPQRRTRGEGATVSRAASRGRSDGRARKVASGPRRGEGTARPGRRAAAAAGRSGSATEPSGSPLESAWSRRSLTEVRRAALSGDPTAQVALGLAYDSGKGVPRDQARALVWFRRAAAHGDSWARNRVGWLLANGRGVERDDAEAVRLFRLAALQGNAEAEFNLAFMYARGRGVVRSDEEAVSWYRRAARHGVEAARSELQRRGIAQ